MNRNGDCQGCDGDGGTETVTLSSDGPYPDEVELCAECRANVDEAKDRIYEGRFDRASEASLTNFDSVPTLEKLAEWKRLKE